MNLEKWNLCILFTTAAMLLNPGDDDIGWIFVSKSRAFFNKNLYSLSWLYLMALRDRRFSKRDQIKTLSRRLIDKYSTVLWDKFFNGLSGIEKQDHRMLTGGFGHVDFPNHRFQELARKLLITREVSLSEVAIMELLKGCDNVIQLRKHISIKIHQDHVSHCLLMEKVPFTLWDLLKQQHFVCTPTQIGDLIVDVLKGLASIHARGVVHCDIKPENIGCTINSFQQISAYIMDFGAAVRMGDKVLICTPEYACPEQYRGTLSATPQFDCFSVGVVLEMSLRAIGAKIGGSIKRIIMKACDPSQRYNNCEEMIEDMNEVLDEGLENGQEFQPTIIVTAAGVYNQIDASKKTERKRQRSGSAEDRDRKKRIIG